MIFAVAFIDYDGDNVLTMHRVESSSECEAMAEVLENQYFDTLDFAYAVADNDTTAFQSVIDDYGYNIEIQALALDD